MPEVIDRGGHLLVIVAHPDDESFGCGSVIAGAVARGARVSVCCATLGEAGELAPGAELKGRSLAEVRHAELRAAADLLGARVLAPLGLLDSGWDGEPPAGSLCALPVGELAALLAGTIKAEGPDAVLTISGDDGHRDHRHLAAAVTSAVDLVGDGTALFQWCLPNELMRRWAAEMTALRPDTAHLALGIADLGTPAERFTHVLDTAPHLDARWRAIRAHASQTSPYEGLSPDLATAFLTRDHLVRVR
jgi:LmbE family N-acetylglucosaminyl deacetylase